MAMGCKYYSYFSSRTPFNDVQYILNKINLEKTLSKPIQDKIKYQNFFSNPKPTKITNQNDFYSASEDHNENDVNFAQYQDQMNLKKANAFHIQQQQEKYLEYLFAKEKNLTMKHQSANNINEWLFTKFNNNYSEIYYKMFPNVYQNQSQDNKLSNQAYLEENNKIIKSQSLKETVPQYQYPFLNEKLKRCSSYKFLINHKLNGDFLNKYELVNELGSGGFGFVLLAKEISTQRKVAVKFIFKNKIPKSAWVPDEKEGFIPMECFIMKQVDHPNIVKYLDSYSDSKLFYIVMELHGNSWAADDTDTNGSQDECQNAMDLFECIESRSMRFTEYQAKYIFKQIFDAVNYLYNHGIVHRDLKDENILIDKQFNIKLADFGAASYLRNYHKNNAYFVNKFLGTLAYAPPEVLKGEEFGNIAQEVFSLGTILYLLIFGEIPFKTPEETLFSNNIYMNAPRNVSCSQEVLNLIEWMLQKNPKDRPSLNSILNHPWMRNNSI